MERVLDLPLRITVLQLCIQWLLQHSCHVDFKSSDRQCMEENLLSMSMTNHCNRGNKSSIVVSDTLHANMVTMMHPPLLSEIMPKHDKNVGDIGKKWWTARITAEKARVFTENNYLFAANMPISGLDNNSQ